MASGVPATAAVELAMPFGQNMVLQRRGPLPVWGTATPGEEVNVSFASQQRKAVADSQGRWQVTLAPMEAGGPFELEVTGTNSIKLGNVMVGDVWLCSGQSNMLEPLSRADTYQQAIRDADNPQLRLFTVKPAVTAPAKSSSQGPWSVSSPASARDFSGVAYFFGHTLQQALGIPIGLIVSAYGGSPIEAWLSPQAAPARSGGGVLQPSSLYKAMVAPLVPFGIRGVIWYQGEANVGQARAYRKLFPALIADWRRAWGGGTMPFLFVQLAGYSKPVAQPGESARAELREAQESARFVPKVRMVVAIDLGDELDMHIKNKQEVGRRLALAALSGEYQEPVAGSSPLYDSMQVEGNKIRVFFRHAASGLATRNGQSLQGFAVAGADGKFTWAKARVDGDGVLVWSDAVPNPSAVRYAWADNPVCNLYNNDGLPCAPFRTDR